MDDRYVNKSLQRALRILDVFDAEHTAWTATEIAHRLDVTCGTLFPALKTMERHGYLIRNEHKQYSLGMKVLELAQVVLGRVDLRSIAQDVLRKTAVAHSVNTHLAVLYDESVMYLHREEGVPSVVLKEVVGKTAPAHCTALGKVLLAAKASVTLAEILETMPLVPFTSRTICDPSQFSEHLQEVRRRGYAVDNEEFHVGSLCVAAPIRDYQGTVIAAVSLSTPVSTTQMRSIRQLADIICRAGEAISERMGHVQRSEPQGAQ